MNSNTPAKKWDGSERRSSPTDHDTLVRMAVVLESHVKNFESHQLDDKQNFKILFRVMYVGLGVLGTIQFLLGIRG